MPSERDPIIARLETSTKRLRLLQLRRDHFRVEPVDLKALAHKAQQLGFGKR